MDAGTTEASSPFPRLKPGVFPFPKETGGLVKSSQQHMEDHPPQQSVILNEEEGQERPAHNSGLYGSKTPYVCKTRETHDSRAGSPWWFVNPDAEPES